MIEADGRSYADALEFQHRQNEASALRRSLCDLAEEAFARLGHEFGLVGAARSVESEEVRQAFAQRFWRASILYDAACAADLARLPAELVPLLLAESHDEFVPSGRESLEGGLVLLCNLYSPSLAVRNVGGSPNGRRRLGQRRQIDGFPLPCRDLVEHRWIECVLRSLHYQEVMVVEQVFSAEEANRPLDDAHRRDAKQIPCLVVGPKNADSRLVAKVPQPDRLPPRRCEDRVGPTSLQQRFPIACDSVEWRGIDGHAHASCPPSSTRILV